MPIQRKKRPVRRNILPQKVSTNAALVAITAAMFLSDLADSVPLPDPDPKVIPISDPDPKVTWPLIKPNDRAEFVVYGHGFKLNAETISTFSKARNIGDLSHLISQPEKIAEMIVPDRDGLSETISRRSCRASEILSLTMFIEKYAKFGSDQTTFNFCYTLVRALPYLTDFKFLKPIIVRDFGKNYYCDLAWTIAKELPNSKVLKQWKDRERQSPAYLADWKKKLQEQAKARWHERKRDISNISKAASQMREQLIVSLGGY